MPQRKYNKEQKNVAKANPRVILPIAYDAYQEIALDGQRFRLWLNEMIDKYPTYSPKKS
jgi:hypothetical protein